MDKLKKIQADILQGHKDSNIRFSDLQKILVAMGGKERVKGDHFIYSFAEIVIAEWLEVAKEDGIAIPKAKGKLMFA